MVVPFMAGSVAAQRPQRDPPAISLSGGPVSYDLGSKGTGIIGALRVDAPVTASFLVEPGISVFHYTNELGNKIDYFMPEVSFQLQVPRRSVRPYVGAGLGEVEFLSGRGSSQFSLHAVGGVRAQLAGRWGIRGEARLRTIDPFNGRTLDLTVGISRSLR
jgi:hypothetical protein